MKKLIALLATTALLGGAASAQAAAPKTGNFSGTLTQKLALLDEPYKTKFGVQVYKGRVILVNVTVRMECGDSAVMDASAFKSFKVGRGPKLSGSGGFKLRVRPNWMTTRTSGVIHVTGALSRKAGSGVASAQVDDCNGRGTWTVARRR